MNETPPHSAKSFFSRGAFSKKLFFLATAFVTLVALFYAEENWRGGRAWEKCKHELEAKGEQLEWANYVPKAVPADQNMMAVPLVDAWFNRNTTNKAAGSRLFRVPPDLRNIPPSMAEVKALPLRSSNGEPSLQGWFDWFSQFEGDMKEFETACRRPETLILSQRTDPFSADFAMPNFVNLRTVAQALATRARAYAVAGKPDDAVHDLALLTRVMDCACSGQKTLVGAMIRVAIGGLYVEIVREGLENRLWPESSLIAIQQQLARMDFFGDYAGAMRGGERAAVNFILENYPRKRIAEMFVVDVSREKKTPVWRSRAGLFIWLSPRGWLYQNQVNFSRLHQMGLDALDLPTQRIDVGAVDRAGAILAANLNHFAPYDYFSAMAMPNILKALQTVTSRQTLVNQAQLACALEQHRLALGTFPESLDALVPRFIAKLPHDVVGGQPMRYGRTSDGKYFLYSIGWNQKDDGGNSTGDKDWVWKAAPEK